MRTVKGVLEKDKFVITLVHGTYSFRPSWIKRGSPLSTHLIENLSDNPDNIVVEPFYWLPLNNHYARMWAAKKLRAHILTQHEKYPSAEQYIIAHSHGGNVSIYAAKDPDVAAKICGIACLATPFITSRIRDTEKAFKIFWPLSIFVYLFVFFIPMAFAAGVVDLVSFIVRYFNLTVSGEFGGILACVLIFYGALLGLMVMPKCRDLLESGKLKEWIQIVQFDCYKKLLYGSSPPPILDLYVKHDEAAAYLGLWHFVSKLPYTLWSKKGVYLYAVGIIMSFLFGVSREFPLFLIYARSSSYIEISKLLGTFILCVPLYIIGIFFFFCEVAWIYHLLISLWGMGAVFFGFGGPVWWNWLIEIGVSKTFTNEKAENREVNANGKGLFRHCRLYNDPTVHETISFWIKGITRVGKVPIAELKMGTGPILGEVDNVDFTI